MAVSPPSPITPRPVSSPKHRRRSWAREAKGLDRAGLLALRESVAAMLEGGPIPSPPFQAYGAFNGVAEHKGRHVCVLLPLEAALEAMTVLETAKPGA